MNGKRFKLIQGDCLEEMDKLIDDGVKVDLVLTDPPYGTTACKWDNIIPFDEMWECLDGITNETSPILLFGTEPFSSHLRLSNITNFKYDWIWDKMVGGNIFNRKHQPLADYEIISVFYNKSGQYYPIMVKAKRDRSYHRKSVTSSNIFGGVISSKDYQDSGKRYPKKIISYNAQEGDLNNTKRVHPTQKPVELLEYLIKTYTNEEDLVLDFTMGSGSTGVACMNTNRKFIGIELDKDYYNIASERIKEANEQKKLI